MGWEDTLRLGISTWKVKPIVHHSSSAKLHEDSKSKLISHADFLYEKFESFATLMFFLKPTFKLTAHLCEIKTSRVTVTRRHT
jgi:hypothetical protein